MKVLSKILLVLVLLATTTLGARCLGKVINVEIVAFTPGVGANIVYLLTIEGGNKYVYKTGRQSNELIATGTYLWRGEGLWDHVLILKNESCK